MLRKLFGLSLGAAAILAAAVPATAAPPASTHPVGVVRTQSGALSGVRDGAVTRYLGVPYAAPPVDELRWKAPRPARPWSGVRQATKSAPACAQAEGRTDQSEDCLYVDVTVPDGGKRNKPVMVWIHGGGFSEGAGKDYDPARMAVQGDVIVVTVEFRLGIFGFFGYDGLPGSGTFGLQDQQAALWWVRHNARAFGGDAHNVTLFGESGGAVGTCAQLTSPSAFGLFDRVIMESGSCDFDWPANGVTLGGPAGSFWTPLAEIQATGQSTAKTLGCERPTSQATLDCLRELGTSEVRAGFGKFYTVATGTPAEPFNPADALRIGLFPSVPVLSGTNHDEQRLVTGILKLLKQPITDEQYPQLIKEAFGDRAGEILRRYPRAKFADAGQAWATVYTDRMWACNQLASNTSIARHARVFGYEFADPHAQPVADFGPDFDAGASHGSELPNLFEVAGQQPIGSDYYTDAQRALAVRMIDYWTTFARTGSPGKAWAPAGSRALQLTPAGDRLIDVAAEHQCAFWQ